MVLPTTHALEVSVTANFERHSKCIFEAHPLTVFYPDNTRNDVSPFETKTHNINGMQFGVQGNDWYWR